MSAEILRSLGLRKSCINLISCPACGRTKIDLKGLAEEIEEKLFSYRIQTLIFGEGRNHRSCGMGCAVNGPGEAKEADFGLAGRRRRGLIFAKGEIIKTVDEEDLAAEF